MNRYSGSYLVTSWFCYDVISFILKLIGICVIFYTNIMSINSVKKKNLDTETSAVPFLVLSCGPRRLFFIISRFETRLSGALKFNMAIFWSTIGIHLAHCKNQNFFVLEQNSFALREFDSRVLETWAHVLFVKIEALWALLIYTEMSKRPLFSLRWLALKYRSFLLWKKSPIDRLILEEGLLGHQKY